MKKLIIILALLFAVPCFADDLLVGHSSVAPVGDYTVNWGWKATTMPAIKSGPVDYCSVYIYQALSGEVSWVVYDNNNGMVGNIVAAGRGQLNFTSPGWYSFPISQEYMGATLQVGKQYYTSMMFQGGNARIGRGDDRYCGTIGRRRHVNQYPYGDYHNQTWPVAPAWKYVNTMPEGCYSWGIWSYGTPPPPPPPPPPRCYCICCGQEIPCGE